MGTDVPFCGEMGFCCWQIGTCVYNGGLIFFRRIKPSGEITVSSELYLKKLVSFNTTSSDNAERDRSNGELIKYMADHFAKCGFVTHYYEIAPNKFNLLALSPSLADGSDSLGLLLSGHSDCVPFIKVLMPVSGHIILLNLLMLIICYMDVALVI